MPQLLIVSSDTLIASQIQRALVTENHELTFVPSAASFYEALAGQIEPLIILDSTLDAEPESLTLCRDYRAQEPVHSRSPILYLSAASDPDHIALALDAGADDCLRKPFADRELAARIRSHLRRLNPRKATQLVFTQDGRSIRVNGREIVLTRTEFDLLLALGQARGGSLAADRLLHTVWKYPFGTGDEALVRNHVRNLRLKIEDDPDRPRYLVSHHGRGYALTVDYVYHGSP